MQWCTPMILSFTLLWDKAILLQHYRILRFVSKISCPAVTCLNVTQRRLKSFTSPRFLNRPNQFLVSRLEIVQFRLVMRSKTLGSRMTAISLLKLTSTTFAPPHLVQRLQNSSARLTVKEKKSAHIDHSNVKEFALAPIKRKNLF